MSEADWIIILFNNFFHYLEVIKCSSSGTQYAVGLNFFSGIKTEGKRSDTVLNTVLPWKERGVVWDRTRKRVKLFAVTAGVRHAVIPAVTGVRNSKG